MNLFFGSHINRIRLLTFLTCVLALASVRVNGQLGRKIPSPNQDTATLIQTIEITRSAYEIELLAVSTYEAALKTTYLKDDTRTHAEQFYADHKRHAETLLNMLDSLGGKSDDIKSIKKNYGGLESEREVIDHLIKCEENSEKELSSDAKKTKNAAAKKLLEQLRNDERAHLKAYEPLRKTATK